MVIGYDPPVSSVSNAPDQPDGGGVTGEIRSVFLNQQMNVFKGPVCDIQEDLLTET